MLPSIFSENLFDDFFDDFGFAPTRRGHNPLYGKHSKNIMKTDVRETDTAYELDIDLPGFKKDDIRLNLQDGYMTISASKDMDKEEQDKKGRYIRQERYSGSCSRSFYVGDVKSNDISAKYDDGILRITIPKEEKKALPGGTDINID